jgi:hypothetical protein
MDKSTNKMSSPATLGDESSPWQSSGTSAGEDDLVHEESMLKRKLAVLEEFMDNGESHSFEIGSVVPLRGDEMASLNQAYGLSTSLIPVRMGR